MSSRLAAASNSLFVTTHGGSMPSASRNKSVSRIAGPPLWRRCRASSSLGGAAPETPGYLTHDDVPGGLLYCARAVQPGTAMTAHGDEVRCHMRVGPASLAGTQNSPAPAMQTRRRSKSTYALPHPLETARRHKTQMVS